MKIVLNKLTPRFPEIGGINFTGIRAIKFTDYDFSKGTVYMKLDGAFNPTSPLHSSLETPVMRWGTNGKSYDLLHFELHEPENNSQDVSFEIELLQEQPAYCDYFIPDTTRL